MNLELVSNMGLSPMIIAPMIIVGMVVQGIKKMAIIKNIPEKYMFFKWIINLKSLVIFLISFIISALISLPFSFTGGFTLPVYFQNIFIIWAFSSLAYSTFKKFDKGR